MTECSIPLGYRMFWKTNQPLPNGWIPVDIVEENVYDIVSAATAGLIIVEKVDNLLYIEWLAKQRNLV